jgi:hypothetical protein
MTKCVLKTRPENTPITPPLFDPSTPMNQNMWDILDKSPYLLSVVRGTACVQSNLR